MGVVEDRPSVQIQAMNLIVEVFGGVNPYKVMGHDMFL